MKTYEQLKQEWGASTYGREFSFYVYEYFQSYAREVAYNSYITGYSEGYESSHNPGTKQIEACAEEFMKQLFPDLPKPDGQTYTIDEAIKRSRLVD